MVMTDEQRRNSENREKGKRAEYVANWYFRLNGFLSIPGFIIHPDRQQRYPRTEADLIAVRFPYSSEIIADRTMEDDSLITNLSSSEKIIFILVEIKVDLCNINGPWSRKEEGNIQRVIRRLGFVENKEIDNIATKMYDCLRWENDKYVLQYISIGARTNEERYRQYSKLIQITWDDIAGFLFRRFKEFPEKLPEGRGIHEQWPDFGKAYGRSFKKINSENDSPKAVYKYIHEGKCSINGGEQMWVSR